MHDVSSVMVTGGEGAFRGDGLRGVSSVMVMDGDGAFRGDGSRGALSGMVMGGDNLLSAEFFEGRLRGLFVQLSLGNERDVLLAPKDVKRYGRKDSAFFAADEPLPRYQVKKNRLEIDYPAGTPSGNRLFFNLKGHGVGDVEDHNLMVDADWFAVGEGRSAKNGSVGAGRMAGDAGDFPEWQSVDGTPLDFRTETPINERIRMGYAPLVKQRGYDHLFWLNKPDGKWSLAAVLTDYARTLRMEVYTDFPALYVYTGNRFSGKEIGKGGCIYPKRGGIVIGGVAVNNGKLPGVGIPEKDTRGDGSRSAESMALGKAVDSAEGFRTEYRFVPLAPEFSRDVKGR